ncbi:NADPH-dependent FMN reductase [Streptomyces sp. SID4919]|uniref:NADPH-dependent FMN reductase n=1 Tax=Streptomyces uncialis TaxID=1048205 RepID=A0A1Q4VF92_9ACTN|nr:MULTISPECIES: NAD(P)H-dependent oxidoreductase [Streptomyces]MCX4660097.1 NAD(P)H-dependent oxidoreductase [Streptomyces uncialis]MYY09866.1 NADPH-dependent FMN reductase [Streptomyces sp. SID4919]OKH96487.1 NADPH-dependent FMN reductase [Streptomyces uncialis]WST68157.1 NAD(P)H-dependent oxidoreductase [Streptomyces uncialis]WTE13206.1 NAD(P)H-dependent oxidoreductase [Streptomyces uncialis]
MTRIAIVIGSTRPGRVGDTVAHWVHEIASKRTDAEFDVVDLRDIKLPLLDEQAPPSFGQYANDHTREWSTLVDSYDGFVFVTPEYNHSTSGALKNAIDYLYSEWNNKAAAFVGYGSAGGSRAIEHLRGIMAEVQVATVRNQVMLSLFTDFENFTTFTPQPVQVDAVGPMLDQLIAWSDALQPLRDKTKAQSATV